MVGTKVKALKKVGPNIEEFWDVIRPKHNVHYEIKTVTSTVSVKRDTTDITRWGSQEQLIEALVAMEFPTLKNLSENRYFTHLKQVKQSPRSALFKV